MIYDTSMLISRPPLYPEKNNDRARASTDITESMLIANLSTADDFPRYISNPAILNAFSSRTISESIYSKPQFELCTQSFN